MGQAKALKDGVLSSKENPRTWPSAVDPSVKPILKPSLKKAGKGRGSRWAARVSGEMRP